MEQRLFSPEGTREEIKDMLETNCDIEQNMHYVEPFSDDERQHEELELSKKTQELFEVVAEIKKATEPLAAEKKNIIESQKQTASLLKQGGYETEGKTYSFLNKEDNEAQIYSQQGRLIEVRPLTRQERQHSLGLN